MELVVHIDIPDASDKVHLRDGKMRWKIWQSTDLEWPREVQKAIAGLHHVRASASRYCTSKDTLIPVLILYKFLRYYALALMKPSNTIIASVIEWYCVNAAHPQP